MKGEVMVSFKLTPEGLRVLERIIRRSIRDTSRAIELTQSSTALTEQGKKDELDRLMKEDWQLEQLARIFQIEVKEARHG